MPIWMLTINWARPGGERPNRVMMTGVAAGFVGVIVLLAPWQTGDRDVYLFGAATVLLGSISWTGASLYTRTVRISSSHFQTTAMQMLYGGAVLTLVGSVAGEWGRVSLGDVSALSALAFFSLVVIGSVVALTAYTWLLGVAQPSRLSTYAYVNPVVAVVLGWLLAGETLTPRMALGVAVIVGAVVLVTMGRTSPRSAPAGRIQVGTTPGGKSRWPRLRWPRLRRRRGRRGRLRIHGRRGCPRSLPKGLWARKWRPLVHARFRRHRLHPLLQKP